MILREFWHIISFELQRFIFFLLYNFLYDLLSDPFYNVVYAFGSQYVGLEAIQIFLYFFSLLTGKVRHTSHFFYSFHLLKSVIKYFLHSFLTFRFFSHYVLRVSHPRKSFMHAIHISFQLIYSVIHEFIFALVFESIHRESLVVYIP